MLGKALALSAFALCLFLIFLLALSFSPSLQNVASVMNGGEGAKGFSILMQNTWTLVPLAAFVAVVCGFLFLSWRDQ